MIRNGTVDTRLANEAPAPSATNKAGKAQQIRVDEDANSENRLAVLWASLV